MLSIKHSRKLTPAVALFSRFSSTKTSNLSPEKLLEHLSDLPERLQAFRESKFDITKFIGRGSHSMGRERMMTPQLVGCEAPNFRAKAVMANGEVKEIELKDYRGKNVILLFYPLDFTFVCPSELLAFSKRVREFEEKNTVVLGCSVDSEFCHLAWRNLPKNQGGIEKIEFPLVSDLTKEIARSYNVLNSDGAVALRGLFLINAEGKIVHSTVNDLPLGRSVDEALRMVDALKHFEEFGEVCPANWKKGEKAMKPTTDGVAEYLSKMQ